MVYTSKHPDLPLFQSGILDFLFSYRRHNCPEDRKLFIDALDGRSITFAQLKDQVLRFGAGLQDVCNFQENDVLCIFAPNQYNYMVPMLGALAANGATSPVNPNYNVDELLHQLTACKAKVIVCHESNLKIALAAAGKVGIPKENVLLFGNTAVDGVQPFETVLFKDRKAVPKVLTYEEANDKIAYLCFSSGTTGKSKGVMTTHSNMTANVPQWAVFDEPFIDPSKDSILAVLPFFHVFGLSAILHTAVYWGMSVYVLPRFQLQTFCEVVEKYRISYIPLAPPVYVQLAKEEIVSNYDLSSFRIGISGAAPLSGSLSRAVTSRLPHLTIKQGYGMTEASPAVTVESIDSVVDGSVGFLLPNMTAKLVDESGKEVARGEPGELWIKGPNIMKGYINNPQATAECIDEEGYYHTGDVAVVDKNDCFYIVDRIKELIKYNGFQVPPAELEGILLKSPIVADCAVIGVYDNAQATELPCACVVLKENIVPCDEVTKEITKFVAKQVISYKQIRMVRYFDQIPKNPSGKILRRLLRDTLKKEEAAKPVVARL